MDLRVLGYLSECVDPLSVVDPLAVLEGRLLKMSDQDQLILKEYDRVNASVVPQPDLVVHVDLIYVDAYRPTLLHVEQKGLVHPDALLLQEQAVEESRALGACSLGI